MAISFGTLQLAMRAVDAIQQSAPTGIVPGNPDAIYTIRATGREWNALISMIAAAEWTQEGS